MQQQWALCHRMPGTRALLPVRPLQPTRSGRGAAHRLQTSSVFSLPFVSCALPPCVRVCCVLLLQGAPKMKVAIIGGGLAGLSTAVELLDQG